MPTALEQAWVDLEARFRRQEAVFRSKYATLRPMLRGSLRLSQADLEAAEAYMKSGEDLFTTFSWGCEAGDCFYGSFDNLRRQERRVVDVVAQNLAMLRAAQATTFRTGLRGLGAVQLPTPTEADYAEARRRIGTRQLVTTATGEQLVQSTGTGPSPGVLLAAGVGLGAVAFGLFLYTRRTR